MVIERNERTPGEETVTVKTLADLRRLAAGETVYVRYSRDHRADIRRGYSLDHSSRTRESGLSAMDINPDDWTALGYVASLLCSYGGRLLMDRRSYGWIAKARRVGVDADGCPTIADVQVIGRLDRRLVSRCRKFGAALEDRRRTHKGVNDPRPWPTLAEFGL